MDEQIRRGDPEGRASEKRWTRRKLTTPRYGGRGVADLMRELAVKAYVWMERVVFA